MSVYKAILLNIVLLKEQERTSFEFLGLKKQMVDVKSSSSLVF